MMFGNVEASAAQLQRELDVVCVLRMGCHNAYSQYTVVTLPG